MRQIIAEIVHVPHNTHASSRMCGAYAHFHNLFSLCIDFELARSFCSRNNMLCVSPYEQGAVRHKSTRSSPQTASSNASILQLMLTQLLCWLQVLQQYGANFVSIQSFNTTQPPAGSRKLQRKLLSHESVIVSQADSLPARRLAQTGSSGGNLQVDMLVTVPAEQQLQVLSPGTAAKASQSLAAAGGAYTAPQIATK